MAGTELETRKTYSELILHLRGHSLVQGSIRELSTKGAASC